MLGTNQSCLGHAQAEHLEREARSVGAIDRDMDGRCFRHLTGRDGVGEQGLAVEVFRRRKNQLVSGIQLHRAVGHTHRRSACGDRLAIDRRDAATEILKAVIGQHRNGDGLVFFGGRRIACNVGRWRDGQLHAIHMNAGSVRGGDRQRRWAVVVSGRVEDHAVERAIDGRGHADHGHDFATVVLDVDVWTGIRLNGEGAMGNAQRACHGAAEVGNGDWIICCLGEHQRGVFARGLRGWHRVHGGIGLRLPINRQHQLDEPQARDTRPFQEQANFFQRQIDRQRPREDCVIALELCIRCGVVVLWPCERIGVGVAALVGQRLDGQLCGCETQRQLPRGRLDRPRIRARRSDLKRE